MKDNRPVQRSIKYLKEKMGMSVDIVERGVPSGRGFMYRKDYLGIIDLIACGHGRMLGVQVTTPKQIKPHIKKILEEDRREDLTNWLSAADLEIWAWPYRAREPVIEVITLPEV